MDQIVGKKDEDAKKIESLGWTTESAMPRKRESRAIELQDGNASAVKLKAALLQAQADVRLHQTDPTLALKRQRQSGDLFRLKNKGIEERNRRDAALNQEESARSNDQLLAKARLYEKMKMGELNHANALVDFERKGLDGEMHSGTIEDEFERRRWEREALKEIKTGVALSKLRKDRATNGVKQQYDHTLTDQEKEILQMVSQQTVEARVKKDTIEQKRKAQLSSRKAKLLARKRKNKASLASLFGNAGNAAATSSTSTSTTSAATSANALARPPAPRQPPKAEEGGAGADDDAKEVLRGRDGEVLKAYEYKPPSPTEVMPEESKPNPHREYAAIAPPSSLAATIGVAKQKAAKRRRKEQYEKEREARKEAQDFLTSLGGGNGHNGHNGHGAMPYPYPYPYPPPMFPYPPHPHPGQPTPQPNSQSHSQPHPQPPPAYFPYPPNPMMRPFPHHPPAPPSASAVPQPQPGQQQQQRQQQQQQQQAPAPHPYGHANPHAYFPYPPPPPLQQ